MDKEEPPDKQIDWQEAKLLIFSLLLLFVCYGIEYYYKPLIEPIRAITFLPETSVIEENSYLARNIPHIPHIYTYGSLIDCLIYYESSGRVDAVGKAGEIGILQFMPLTYKHFCVDKYGLPDDIMNPEYQKECSDKMLKENLGHHWTTLPKCQRNDVSNVIKKQNAEKEISVINVN